MKEVYMLGKHVEHFARRKGMTIDDMARAMGCSKIQVQRFLKGFAYASFQQIKAIAVALEVSVEDLLSDNDECYEDGPTESETVLDIIHDYVDVVDAVNAAGENAK